MNHEERFANHDAILRNHSEQLTNLHELAASLSTMLGILHRAQEAQQKIFEALQRAVTEKMGGGTQADEQPGPVN